MIKADNEVLKETLSLAVEELKILEEAKAIQDGILSPVVEEGKTASTLEIESEAEKKTGNFFSKGSKESRALAVKREQILDYLRSELDSNSDFEDILNVQELFEYVKISVKAFELIKAEREETDVTDQTVPQLSSSAYVREMIMAFIVKISKVVRFNDSSRLHAVLREEIASKGIRIADLQKQNIDLDDSILALEKTIENDLQKLGSRVTDTLVVSRMMTSVGQYDMRRIGDAYFKEFYHNIVETGFNGFLGKIVGFFTNSIFKTSKQSVGSSTVVKETVNPKPSIVTAAKKSSSVASVKLESKYDKTKKEKKEAPVLKLRKMV